MSYIQNVDEYRNIGLHHKIFCGVDPWFPTLSGCARLHRRKRGMVRRQVSLSFGHDEAIAASLLPSQLSALS